MDTVLRGATVVDGTGQPARQVDVGIDQGRIVAVGEVEAGAGTEEVDLSGLMLAPGVIDIHTHYDAQVFWDGALTPSSWHGVTTIVQGNCGFGIAPARPGDRQMIMETLELVEGMNLRTLESGIRWEYETYPEYLDVLRSIPKRINVAALAPHSMFRLYAMGPEAAFSRTATDEELTEIKRLLREAVDAGAIGISTSQAPSHQGPKGLPVPSRFADRREVVALLEVLREAGRKGIAEITYGPLFEIEECARLSAETGVRITWGSVLPGLFGPPGAAQAMLERGMAAGGDLWPQTSTRFITTQMSWLSPYEWSRVPAFQEVLGRSPEVMAKVYADPEWRDRARAEAIELDRRGEKDFLGGDMGDYFRRTSVVETTRHTALQGVAVSDLAAERGVHPLDVMLDLALEEDLLTRFARRSRGTLEELRALVSDPRMVLGAHDGGAHVDMLCDSCYPSYTLRYWVREQGAMTWEEAAYRMSGQPAEVFGLTDRGRIAPGLAADLMAFDPDTVSEGPLERVYDFPGDADRLISHSQGIEHIWVGGTAIRRAGEDLDDARPGQVVSS